MQTRKWTASTNVGFATMAITFEAPFFDDFLIKNGGALNNDFEAHALFHYFGVALQAYTRAKDNLVLEEEHSIIFNVDKARQLFKSIADQHGVSPEKMVNYWPMIHRQRIAMGGKDQLPEQFQFRYWGN